MSRVRLLASCEQLRPSCDTVIDVTLRVRGVAGERYPVGRPPLNLRQLLGRICCLAAGGPWGAVSFKFYTCHLEGKSWRADDPKIAYPLWEKARSLGIKVLQERHGFPGITETDKRRILGESQANLFGIDSAKKKREFAAA
jgi:hypothetical protein